MKSVTAAAIVLACATSAGGVANAQSSPPAQLQHCMARVVYSEELPFAPIDTWLVKVTLEITPRNGPPYYTTLQDRMPWQGPPPRRGQAFRLWCDPANPGHLHLASGRFLIDWDDRFRKSASRAFAPYMDNLYFSPRASLVFQ
jgi:hypothetical protein